MEELTAPSVARQSVVTQPLSKRLCDPLIGCYLKQSKLAQYSGIFRSNHQGRTRVDGKGNFVSVTPANFIRLPLE